MHFIKPGDAPYAAKAPAAALVPLASAGAAGVASMRALAALGCGALLLSGCASLPFGDASPASNNTGRRAEDVTAPRAAAARTPNALRDGIKLYDDGDFNGAIRRLSAADGPGEGLGNRLIALKYMAFSYCVTGRPGPCRQAFEKALKLDPSFDLGPGEHSHPLWGPVFAKAKRGN